MVIKGIHFSLRAVSIASLLVMAIFIATFAWIVTGPRSLSFLNPYVEKQLSAISPDYKVTISDSLIRWNRENRSLSLDVTQVSLLSDTDETLINFPEISFDFSLIRLLKGQILSSDLTLIRPSFYLDLSQKALYVSKKNNLEIGSVIGGILAGGLGKTSSSFPINSVKITDANFYIDNGYSEFLWHVKEGYARLKSSDKENKIISEFLVDLVKEDVKLSMEVTADNKKSSEIKVSFQNFPSYIAYDLFPKVEELKNIDIRSDGSFELLLGEDGVVEQLNLDLTNAEGEVYIPLFFKKKIKIKNTELRASLYNGFSVLTIDSLKTNLFGPLINIAGTIKNLDNPKELNIDTEVSLESLPVDDLSKYWPLEFGGIVREWVLENITGGNITKAIGHFIFTPEDLKKLQEWSLASDDFKAENPPPLPEKSIDATIFVEGTNVHYLPDYPDVTNVTGQVNFTSSTMSVMAQSGKIFSSDVNAVSVKFNNMWQHPLVIEIEGNFTGKAEDAVPFLKAAVKNHPETEMFDSIYQATGDATGTVFLSIPIKKDLLYHEMQLKINSKFTNATLPKFFHGQDLTSSDFDMDLNNDSISVVGQTKLNNNDLAVSFERDFTGQQEFDNSYHIKGFVSGEDLQKLDIIKEPYITDKIGLDVNLKEKGTTQYLEGNLDVTPSVISIPGIGFDKISGRNGQIEFSAIKKDDGTLEINKLLAKGDKLSADGTITLSNNFSEISAFDFNYLELGETNLKVKYSNTANAVTLIANGKSLDLSNAKLGKLLKTDANSKKAFDIKADFDTVIMKGGEVIRNFTSNANCDVKLCKSINAYGKFHNDNFIVLSMKPLGDRSSLMLESDNAGAMLNAFGITPNVRDGNLNLEATFTDYKGGRIARGHVKMHEFRAVQTPTLGKLLTLASLQGISDILNNEGITFKHFDAPFVLDKGVITVTEAKTSGSSVGITSDGTIDTTSGEIDLYGVIVPAYAINKVLGDIPVLGNLLVGNKNEGVFASKYKINGSYDDAKVSVNPLSIITPGFLRNVFDINKKKK